MRDRDTVAQRIPPISQKDAVALIKKHAANPKYAHIPNFTNVAIGMSYQESGLGQNMVGTRQPADHKYFPYDRAVGLFQFMGGSSTKFDRYNHEQNVENGLANLAKHYAKFNGRMDQALLAHNYGAGNDALEAGQRPNNRGGDPDFDRKILKHAERIANGELKVSTIPGHKGIKGFSTKKANSSLQIPAAAIRATDYAQPITMDETRALTNSSPVDMSTMEVTDEPSVDLTQLAESGATAAEIEAAHNKMMGLGKKPAGDSAVPLSNAPVEVDEDGGVSLDHLLGLGLTDDQIASKADRLMQAAGGGTTGGGTSPEEIAGIRAKALGAGLTAKSMKSNSRDLSKVQRLSSPGRISGAGASTPQISPVMPGVEALTGRQSNLWNTIRGLFDTGK